MTCADGYAKKPPNTPTTKTDFSRTGFGFVIISIFTVSTCRKKSANLLASARRLHVGTLQKIHITKTQFNW